MAQSTATNSAVPGQRCDQAIKSMEQTQTHKERVTALKMARKEFTENLKGGELTKGLNFLDYVCSVAEKEGDQANTYFSPGGIVNMFDYYKDSSTAMDNYKSILSIYGNLVEGQRLVSIFDHCNYDRVVNGKKQPVPVFKAIKGPLPAGHGTMARATQEIIYQHHNVCDSNDITYMSQQDVQTLMRDLFDNGCLGIGSPENAASGNRRVSSLSQNAINCGAVLKSHK